MGLARLHRRDAINAEVVEREICVFRLRKVLRITEHASASGAAKLHRRGAMNAEVQERGSSLRISRLCGVILSYHYFTDAIPLRLRTTLRIPSPNLIVLKLSNNPRFQPPMRT